ncbi:DUF1120 domain-containing protein [Klebsiella aerogenes]|uniref:DUF1120 domain-containing protein n=1 Tax=Klebsiella aerogenes TaxID=548 RepID=UPI0004A0379D|nr:DUF1120 domain-containing protein [Klebsiella aerogenes]KDF17711.1 hypothetical protein AF47_03160 [Klebsiella aerogenes MGH 61]HCR0082550.1 DUF1120 domain-containing protein [Klebsiella aerogenes]HCR0509852.1 DUF1120 domain-containing protein [Klebsiella aerogenes]HDS5548000.1 DUF1120 domain-containing protein [Klebsiella aerogenes]HEM8659948.1 DUF1120 domain-containing protein [Klebsiella aerogenes]
MELKRNTLASFVLIVSGLSLSAHAADSFNINVTGVISPAACEANITGGETIDYGTIHASKLSADAVTVLPGKQTAFTVTCDAPAKLGFRTVDNRAATKMTTTGNITMDSGSVWGMSRLNGLGVDSKGNPVGGWSAELNTATADTVSDPEMIFSVDEGTSWVKGGSRDGKIIPFFMDGKNEIGTISTAGTLTPAAFSTLTGTLAVQAVINPASTLDLSQPVTLDGSVTVEMVYL